MVIILKNKKIKVFWSIFIIVLFLSAGLIYLKIYKDTTARNVEKINTVDTIENFNYVLNSNAPKYYKNLFKELKEILKKANLPSNYLELSYDCEKCKDTGYVDGKMCNCLKKILRNETYNQLNKLSPLSLSTFESFKLDYYDEDDIKEKSSNRCRMEKILNYCINYAENFNKKGACDSAHSIRRFS